MKTPELPLADLQPGSNAANASLPPDEGDNSEWFRPVVLNAIGGMLEPEERSAWEVEEVAGPEQMWVHVKNAITAHALPAQGWKIHVSAGATSAEEVLRRVLPILLREDATFKVASSVANVLYLNQGRGGLSQVGKFITVYPSDDRQAVRLAVALDEATRGLRGPYVSSDRPLSPGSLVYYRYGGFAGQHIHTKTGRVVSVINSPAGEPVTDYRATIYTPPEWAVDPFLEAGVATPLEPPNKIVGGRFFVIAPLYESAASILYLAVDTETPRKCVLKRARRDAAVGKDGRDARDRLRNEAEALARLAPDPHFPEFYALIEEGDDLYLALEYIEGDILAAHVQGMAAKHGYVPGEQMMAWAGEIAAALKKVHSKDIVYRDLKSNNVMLAPHDRLVIIDFGLSHDLRGEIGQFNMGTRGYMSPRHRAWEEATLQDDIYSFGALLYFLATRAEPAGAPDETDLLARPVELLNPTVAPALRDVIVRCLHPDPEARYHSISEVEAALQAISEPTVPPPAWGQEILPGDDEEAEIRARYAAWARALGDTLCKVARPARNGQGVIWVSRVLSGSAVQSRYVNIGCSGQVLALAELVREFNDPLHRATLREGVRWLLSQERFGGEIGAGLYVGEAGVASALLRAGQVLHDHELITAASDLSKWVATLPHEAPDIFNGSAGRVRHHLFLWDETQDRDHLHFAIEAGERLLDMSMPAEKGGLKWPTPEEYGGGSFVGYAHGAAGVGDALLDLYEATGDDRFLQAAIGAGRWLAQQAVPIDNEHVPGLHWPRLESGTLNEGFWCHGAAGIGGFFLHLANLQAMEEAREIAARAALTVARATRWAVPVQCHGLAGNIEFLLDMYQATEDSAFLAEAKSLARLLETFRAHEKGLLVWSADLPTRYSPDYTIGYSGIAMCLLRLADPGRLPRQLSRAGFRVR
jgi:tRNA A-37 threonylcarbamoyl transferase component Bud32